MAWMGKAATRGAVSLYKGGKWAATAGNNWGRGNSAAMWRGYKKMASSPMASGVGKLARLPGKAALHPVGGYAVMGMAAAAMTYDPTQKKLGSHTAQEGVKIGADMVFDTAAFAAFGMTAMLPVMGLSLMGLSPGQLVGNVMDSVGEEYNKQVKGRPTPIEQNKRTMGAMQKSMALLGQSSRRHSMLGSEGQMMHN